MSSGGAEEMRVCPRCEEKNDGKRDTCVKCEAPLEEPKKAKKSSSSGEDTAQLLGRVLNGKYEVLSVLGQGGMGVVYKVRHLILQRRNLFALKILHPKICTDERFRERFLREAEVAMELTHENIVQTRDFGITEDSRLFFTMDYFAGLSLRALIGKEGRMPAARAIGIMRQVLNALCEAHRQRVVHRDLKPDNVLVRREAKRGDQVKILDFGIAKIVDNTKASDVHATRSGLMGSPRYMSPEQVTGDSVDHRSDLYSVGVMFYELLTGTPPFRGKTAQEVLRQHLTVRAPRIGEKFPRIQLPAQLEDLVSRLLEKEPGKRPATPRDVLHILETGAAPDAAVAARHSRVSRRWIVAALILVASGLGVWLTAPARLAHLRRGAATPQAEASGGSEATPRPRSSGANGAADGPRSEGADAPRDQRPAPAPSVRLRCQICGDTFLDGELEANTHHDLPLEKVSG